MPGILPVSLGSQFVLKINSSALEINITQRDRWFFQSDKTRLPNIIKILRVINPKIRMIGSSFFRPDPRSEPRQKWASSFNKRHAGD